MAYKYLKHKYFDRDSDPWRRSKMAVAENEGHPVGLKVLFVSPHPRHSDLTRSFVGQVGEVISHSDYTWEGVKWCVRFIVKDSKPVKGQSLWLRPKYLKVLSENQES